MRHQNLTLRFGWVCFSALAGLLFCPDTAAAANGKLTGMVKKAVDSTPLHGAKVTIVGTTRTTKTDKEGKYSFDSLEIGQTYQLTIKRDFYKDASTETTVRVAEPNEAAPVELDLLRQTSLLVLQLNESLALRQYDEFDEAANALKTICSPDLAESNSTKDCETIAKIVAIADKARLSPDAPTPTIPNSGILNPKPQQFRDLVVQVNKLNTSLQIDSAKIREQ